MSRFNRSDFSLSELLMVIKMTVWESWGCSGWRGESFRETFRELSSALRCYKKAGERLFTMTCSDWTGGNVLELKEGRFRIDFRKKFFIVRVVRHWA